MNSLKALLKINHAFATKRLGTNRATKGNRVEKSDSPTFMGTNFSHWIRSGLQANDPMEDCDTSYGQYFELGKAAKFQTLMRNNPGLHFVYYLDDTTDKWAYYYDWGEK